jgi:hypothetical protein
MGVRTSLERLAESNVRATRRRSGMKRGPIVVFVSAVLCGAVWAASPDALSSKAHASRVAPGSITSEASMEFYIAMAASLTKGDTQADITKMAGQLDVLKKQRQPGNPQLAKVDVEIKGVMAEIARKRDEESREQDDIRRAQDAFQGLLDALLNADRARTEMAGAVSIGSYARSLSPAKRREAESRARAALAQLSEARHVRLVRAATIYEPALRPVAKPLPSK